MKIGSVTCAPSVRAEPSGETAHDHLATVLDRVLASQAFAKTARLSSFLRHICMASIDGRVEDLTEQRIGQQVFGRTGHYNPTEDTIVRSTARLLRQRLEAYYAGEGRDDPWRLAVPRGAYVPVVVAAVAAEDATCAEDTAVAEVEEAAAPGDGSAEGLPQAVTVLLPEPALPRARRVRSGLRWIEHALRVRARSVWAVLFLFAVVSVMGASAFAPPARPAASVDAMWAELFANNRDTLLVVADSNLVLYQLELLKEVALDDYIAKRIAPDPARADVKFLRNRHTSVATVGFAVELGKLAGARQARLQTRYARDLQLNELKQSSAILLGVRQSNPWVELFRDRFNFHIDWDIATEKFLVRNDRPLDGERPVYEFSKDDPQRRGYVHIAFTRGLGAAGHMLLVAGTTAAGAEAAQEFVLDARRMQPLLQQATRSDGSIGDFELLLQCVLQAGGSTDVQLIAMRAGRS